MIRRGKHQTDFTILPNDALNDRSLSFEARGILGYLLSKPESWIVHTKDLQNEGSIGRDKVLRILKELEKAGYLVRERQRRTDGRLGHIDYVVFDRPNMQIETDDQAQDDASPHTENPVVAPQPEKPAPVKPAPVNPDVYKGLNPTKDEKGQRTEAADAAQPDLLGDVSPKKKPRNKHPIPEGVPNADDLSAARAYWSEKGGRGLDAADEAERFRDHHKARGNQFSDWHAAWRTWFRNALKYQRKDLAQGGAPSTAQALPEDQKWRTRLEGFRERNVWAVAWGPKPGEAGCGAPKKLVDEILPGRKVA